MDTELLRAFVAVTETGGFSAATSRLNRTQSAVSLQIRRLEERLGAPLFERTSRSVRLTETGSRLLPYARRMLRLSAEAHAAVADHPPATPLRVGLSEEQALACLPSVLPAFTAAWPDTRLEIACELSTVLIERIARDELDLALAIRHRHSRTGVAVARKPLVWVGPEGLRRAADAPVDLALNPEGCLYRACALDALGRAGLDWRIVFSSQNPASINIAVRAGLAITVKTPRSLPARCRALGADDGLPPLPSVELELHQATREPTGAAVDFRRRLLAAIAATDGVEMIDGSASPQPAADG